MFLGYAALAVLAACVYRGLPRDAGTSRGKEPSRARTLASPRLHTCRVFSLDSFGGGFVVQTLVALWLYQRFDVPLSAAGSIFFVTGVLTAFSYLVASRLASRFGLLRTMVFTHLPSSLCLLALPFCPELSWAVALLLARAALSQMDVPTRSFYVMAAVTPAERPAAASDLLTISPFGWAFIAGGSIKIVYDLLLLAIFRRIQPPEEADVLRE